MFVDGPRDRGSIPGRIILKAQKMVLDAALLNTQFSLPYYLLIAGGRVIEFVPFPRVLVLCEMLSASSRIWTRVTVSISSDDNHYTTATSLLALIPREVPPPNIQKNFTKTQLSWQGLYAHCKYDDIRCRWSTHILIEYSSQIDKYIKWAMADYEKTWR